MALTNESSALRARNLITEKNEAFAAISLPKILSIIPTALGQWGIAAIKDPSKRDKFLLPFNIDITDGQADLTAYFNGDTATLDKSSFGCANVSLAGGAETKWLGSLTQLKYPRALGGAFVGLYLDGNTLKTRNTDGSPTTLNDTLAIKAVALPQTVDEIPEDLDLEGSFLLALAALAMREFPPPKTKSK